MRSFSLPTFHGRLGLDFNFLWLLLVTGRNYSFWLILWGLDILDVSIVCYLHLVHKHCEHQVLLYARRILHEINSVFTDFPQFLALLGHLLEKLLIRSLLKVLLDHLKVSLESWHSVEELAWFLSVDFNLLSLLRVELFDSASHLFLLLLEDLSNGLVGQLQLANLSVAQIAKALLKAFKHLLASVSLCHNAHVLLVHVSEVLSNLVEAEIELLDHMTYSCVLDDALGAQESNITLTEELYFLIWVAKASCWLWLLASLILIVVCHVILRCCLGWWWQIAWSRSDHILRSTLLKLRLLCLRILSVVLVVARCLSNCNLFLQKLGNAILREVREDWVDTRESLRVSEVDLLACGAL